MGVDPTIFFMILLIIGIKFLNDQSKTLIDKNDKNNSWFRVEMQFSPSTMKVRTFTAGLSLTIVGIVGLFIEIRNPWWGFLMFLIGASFLISLSISKGKDSRNIDYYKTKDGMLYLLKRRNQFILGAGLTVFGVLLWMLKKNNPLADSIILLVLGSLLISPQLKNKYLKNINIESYLERSQIFPLEIKNKLAGTSYLLISLGIIGILICIGKSLMIK